MLGYAYAGQFHAREAYAWAVETSIYVDESCKHMGIGGKLHAALEEALKEQGFLNMNACIAYAPNDDEQQCGIPCTPWLSHGRTVLSVRV